MMMSFGLMNFVELHSCTSGAGGASELLLLEHYFSSPSLKPMRVKQMVVQDIRPKTYFCFFCQELVEHSYTLKVSVLAVGSSIPVLQSDDWNLVLDPAEKDALMSSLLTWSTDVVSLLYACFKRSSVTLVLQWKQHR